MAAGAVFVLGDDHVPTAAVIQLKLASTDAEMVASHTPQIICA